ncbi:MAG: hypothetical protein QNI92_17570 [Desulfobacterales bacterium]|nr:hypothetical protein [Desulfobacterales bacterium]
MKVLNPNRTVMIVALIAIFGGAIAEAHKVTVFAWVEGDTVYVESKFSGGRNPQNAQINVFDLQNHLLLQGTTNAQGKYSFKAPHSDGLKIELQGGMGHRAEWTLTAEDFMTENSHDEKFSSPPVAIQATGPSTHKQKETQNDQDAVTLETGLILSSAEMQAMIETTIDRKLEPIRKMLIDSQQKGPSATDILGGLGYIIGLLGIAAYFKYRATNKK